jgi:hypothetical protein
MEAAPEESATAEAPAAEPAAEPETPAVTEPEGRPS